MLFYKLAGLSDLLPRLDVTKEVYLDTETSKYYSDVRLVQVYQEHWPDVLLFDTKNNDTVLFHLWVVLADCYLVLHNGIYDFYSICADTGWLFTPPKKWEDTFYLSRLAFPEWQKYSLDKGLSNILGYDPYDKAGLRKKELQESFERLKVKNKYIEGPEGLKELTENQLLYAAIDVYELPKLYNAVKHFRDDPIYKLDKITAETVVMDKKGLPVDIDKLQELIDSDTLKIAELAKKLPAGLNVNSYMQVRKLLGTVANSDEEALSLIVNRPGGLSGMKFVIKPVNGKFPKAVTDGLKAGTIKGYKMQFGDALPLSYTEIMNDCKSLAGPKGSSLAIEETSYKHTSLKVEQAMMINEVRKALKRLNFADRAKSVMQLDKEGIWRIKAHFSPHAINGRIQVDNENLSQYPRSMKKMWGHKPGSGRKLVYSDFAQIELRIICAALPEYNMYNSLKSGIDLHTFVANNLNLTEEQMKHLPAGIKPRFIAKQCNFLLLYGGGNDNFQRTVCKLAGVYFNDELTATITSRWKEIFNGIPEWHKKNSKSKTKMDETVLGRKYKADSITDLNNIRVSGTGAEIFKLWLHYINKYKIAGDDGHIVNRVHDSVILDVPESADYGKISRNLVRAAQKAWFEVIQFAPLKDVPMPCDVAVGNNWEDIENEENLNYKFTLDGMYMFDKELENELEK